MDTLPRPYQVTPYEARCDGLRDASGAVVSMCQSCLRQADRPRSADTTWTAPPPSALLGLCTIRLSG